MFPGLVGVRCHVRFLRGGMETTKRQRGRPRRAPDTFPFWQFMRAATAICGYDEARARGEKHSVAVVEATDFVKKLHPGMPISESEVKRALATWRPRGSSTILRFERSSPSEEDGSNYRWVREQIARLEEKRGLKLPVLGNREITTKLIVRVGERPNYPRHNRKVSWE